MAQGFGIAHPMPAALLPEWIRQFKPDELWGLATAFKWSHEDLPMLIADVDHSRWKKSLYAYLDDASGAVRPPELDHHQCRFGRWYDSQDGQRYASAETFPLLEILHRDLHEIASRLRHCHDTGESNAIEALKLEFEEQGSKLNELIKQIQAEVLITTHTSKQ
jgi:hypothetical protein